MWTALLSILPNIVGRISDHFENKRRVEQAKVESELRIREAMTNANINLAQAGQVADIEWAKTMAEASKDSWKDEYWTIVLGIPAIMSFVPGLVPYVELGFHALTQTPEWYQGALLISIGASFGVRIWGRAKEKLSVPKPGN